MSIEVSTILLFASMLVLLVSGLPIAFVLGAVALIFAYLIMGPASLGILTNSWIGLVGNFTLLAIPMFILMAFMLERSGLIDDLYTMMQNWFGGVRGGLAIGTVIISAIMAGMSGVSAADTVALGLTTLPPMLKRGYDKRLAIGTVAAGGGLAQLIPPSAMLIVYGLYAGESVGRLFLGGIIPGLILSALFIIYISVRCYFQPHIGPSVPLPERASWSQKFTSLKAVILPIILIIMVLGTMFSGMTTPSEAATIGAFGSMIVAAIYRRISWANITYALFGTLRLTCMILWLMLGGMAFAAVFNAIGGQQLMVGVIQKIQLSPWIIIIFIQITWIILGCLMDANGIMFITMPVFLPVISALGFSRLWFGVLWVVNMEMGFLTPPFGMNLFYMRAVVPKGITMPDIYRSIVPFLFCQLVGLIICMIFPQSVLWLPNLIIKG